MARELIADVSLITSDPDSYFETSWGWPTSQAVYDQTISDFMFGVHNLHNRIEANEHLGLALGLVKSDLLKDISYFMAAWIDVISARQSGLTVKYADDQFIFDAVERNVYPDVSPTLIQRIGSRKGLKKWVKNKAAYMIHKRKNSQALRSSKNAVFSTSLNPLGKQIAPLGTSALRLTTTDVTMSRPTFDSPTKLIAEVAEQVEVLATNALGRSGFVASGELKTYIQRIGNQHLSYGWFDVNRRDLLAPRTEQATLITGTGSGYSSRLLSLQFLRRGNDVVRTSHGGDAPLFKDVLRPTIEYPFCSTYVVNGPKSATLVEQSFEENLESKQAYFPSSVVAVGSRLHRSVPRPPNQHPPRRIAVISASFNRMYRITPFQKVHDVVYLDWHRRLLKELRDMGYDTVAKRHPKGHISNIPVFGDVCSEELIAAPMADIFEDVDAFVIDFPASAFMEAICTEKPVVLIDMGIRPMHVSVREQMVNSIAVVRASFDENNRVVVDVDEIQKGLETPVNIEERSRFVRDYLTQESAASGSIFDNLPGSRKT